MQAFGPRYQVVRSLDAYCQPMLMVTEYLVCISGHIFGGVTPKHDNSFSSDWLQDTNLRGSKHRFIPLKYIVASIILRDIVTSPIPSLTLRGQTAEVIRYHTQFEFQVQQRFESTAKTL